jgi:hypothetical protein
MPLASSWLHSSRLLLSRTAAERRGWLTNAKPELGFVDSKTLAPFASKARARALAMTQLR